MRPPCDEAVIRSVSAAAPCGPEARPWVLAATILASSMAFIDSTVVNVALPALQASFHVSVVGVQWVVESYGLFLGALILVGGSLGDLFGRRRIFVIGVAIFALASVGCGLASNILQLLVARSIQGVGAAFLVPGSLAIISVTHLVRVIEALEKPGRILDAIDAKIQVINRLVAGPQARAIAGRKSPIRR